MAEFHETGMGKTFYLDTMPKIAKSLGEIARLLMIIAGQGEKEKEKE